VLEDLARANHLQKRGCDAGDLAACAAYSQMKGIDPKLQLELERRVCDGGEQLGCFDLGHALLRAGDAIGAREAYEISCTMSGGMFGCSNLAEMYLHGKGVRADRQRGIELYERACTGRDLRGCHTYATMLVDGSSAPASMQRAYDLLAANCERLWGPSCASAAALVDDGKRMAADPERATALRHRACELDPLYCPADAGVPDAR
jgi:TPR repeat protein